MPVPLVLLAGVDPQALDAAVVAVQFDAPGTAVVRHHVDHVDQERAVLHRSVSDAGGLLDRAELPLDGGCVGCALADDLLSTLRTLVELDRWRSVVVRLPAGAAAAGLCERLVHDDHLGGAARVAAVVAVAGGASAGADPAEGDVVDDLLGDDLLAERGLHLSTSDRRGVGEVLCGIVEHADVVVTPDRAGDEAAGLLHALARPDARLVGGAASLEVERLLAGRHDHARASAWVSSLRDAAVPPLPDGPAWRLELSSDRPFDPQRLLEEIHRLGGGRHRSRGCFWLPTRPGRVLEWAGAGGQLSVGTGASWQSRQPATRLLLTGVIDRPADLPQAFADLLARPGRVVERRQVDGFEPWLGPIEE